MRSDPDEIVDPAFEEAFATFYLKWRGGLRSPTDLWEGYRAVEELRIAGYDEKWNPTPPETVHFSMLDFVLREGEYRSDPRSLDMLERVLGEVESYKKQKLRWRSEHDRKDSRDTELLLSKVGRDLTRQLSRVGDAKLKQLLEDVVGMIDHRRAEVRKLRNRPERSPMGPWEMLWPSHPRMENLQKQIDLDTRLQIQTAKLLRTFLQQDARVSIRTIARLVVLVYQITGLASEFGKEGFLRMVDSGRKITVRSVEEKLRRNGIR